MKFSANLGFLWNDIPLPEAIRAAARAGFEAVECHWPYDTPAEDVANALSETKLTMLGLNTRRGQPGENGLLALPEREVEARAAIDEAIDYAVAIGAQSVHAMAGVANGEEAHKIYCENLRYACERAGEHGITILIEPLNPYDAPGYFLNSSQQAAEIIAEVNRPELRMMFDCYHHQIISGDVCRSFEKYQPLIGHVQIASVPARGRPDEGEIDYQFILSRIGALGWPKPIGAEYRPNGPTGESLSWLENFKKI